MTARRRSGQCRLSTRSRRSRAASTPAASRTWISTATSTVHHPALRRLGGSRLLAGRRRDRRRQRAPGRVRRDLRQDEDRPRGPRTVKLLLVDNYDSFTYNLAHLFGKNGAEVDVIRNDSSELVDGITARYDATCIGPGPGRPEGAGRPCRSSRRLRRTPPALRGLSGIAGDRLILRRRVIMRRTSCTARPRRSRTRRGRLRRPPLAVSGNALSLALRLG